MNAPEFAAALERLGAGPARLAPSERAALERDGYVVLRGVIDATTARDWAEAVGRLRGEAGSERGTLHVEHVLERDARFAAALAEPRLLAAAWQVLGEPFALTGFAARDPQPGSGRQGLHADWMPRAPGEAASVVTALWMLDAFDARNGATRLVPGSHRLPHTPPRALADPAARHPAEVRASGPAGSVLVFDGHLWHAGARNDSDTPRRSLQVQFTARARLLPTQVAPSPPAGLDAGLRALLFD